jgi:hypothetical protein
MSRLFILLAALSSCAAPLQRGPSTLSVGQPKSYFINDDAPSRPVLQAAIDAAIAGDDAKLAYVISLVQHTDGEGAERYGELLNDLQRAVTPQRFQRVLSTLDQNVRATATAYMRVALHNHKSVRQLTRPNQSMQPTTGRSEANLSR